MAKTSGVVGAVRQPTAPEVFVVPPSRPAGETGGTPAPLRAPGSAPATRTAPGRTDTSGLLLVGDGRVERVPWARGGMDLMREIGRLLRAEDLTMVRLGTDLTLWHGATGAGSPDPAASRLMAAYGFRPVAGPVAGRCVGHDPFPLGADEIDGVARRPER
ncbi:hypothetical protein [Streptomyces sp. NPDC001744]|uniref:hypothetical protein n=1 Tax=Streptomyces sp. NPDC001744 TaxID=3364606 RepID=UPI003697DA38